MSQSRGMSLLEAVTNVLAGWLVALATQMVVFPVVGLQATGAQNLALSGTFTGVSLVRSYLLRRLFVGMSSMAPGKCSCSAGSASFAYRHGATGDPSIMSDSGNDVFPDNASTHFPTCLGYWRGVAAWSYAAYSVRICFRGGSTPASLQHTLRQRLKRLFERVLCLREGQARVSRFFGDLVLYEVGAAAS